MIVRILGTNRELEAALADDEAVGTMLANIVWMCEGTVPAGPAPEAAWELLTEEGTPLPSSRTLRECAVPDGAMLRLRPVSAVGLVPNWVEARAPLPAAVPLGERLKAVAGALVAGSAEPSRYDDDGDQGSLDRLTVARPATAIQRVQQVWESTDYKKPSRPNYRRPPPDPVRDDRGGLAQGWCRQDHDHGDAGVAAGHDQE